MHSKYDTYPVWMILLANAVSISIYALGVFILAQLGILFAVLFLFYCIFFEIRLYRQGCRNCYYFDKVCGFGKGKVCSFLFNQGDPKKFIERRLTWRDMLPDVLLLVFPFLGGIFVLLHNFEWVIAAALIVIVFLSFMGNAFIRGSLTCTYCKQRELGCPAYELFSQANNGNS